MQTSFTEIDFGTTKPNEEGCILRCFQLVKQMLSFGFYATVFRRRMANVLDTKPELLREFCGHLVGLRAG